jgi:plastocyanin
MTLRTVPALLLLLGGGAGGVAGQDVSGRIVGVPRARGAVLVVYLAGSAPTATASPEATIAQRQKTFVPHVLPIAAGTVVSFLNEDSILHNLHAYQDRRTLFNRAQPAFMRLVRHTFTRQGTVLLLCDVHPEMEAYLVVTPTPWYDEVARDGTFTLRNVTPGTYTIVVWDERRRDSAAEQPLLVGPAGLTGVTLRLPSGGQ